VHISKFMNKNLMVHLAVLCGKLIYLILRFTGRQGTALPGKIALTIYPSILKDLSKRVDKSVVITGTNGKTTTNNLINHILEGKYSNLVSNLKGANMIQGIVTSFIVNYKKHYDWGIFEVDEGSIPDIIPFFSPNYFILTNFFRDQLDRYGEVENTIKMVYRALKSVDSTIILNSDDPSTIQFNNLSNKKIYYGFNKNQFSKNYYSVAEDIICKECSNRLSYNFISYANIGDYYCDNCGSKRPQPNYAAESIEIKNNSYEFTLKTNEYDSETNFIFKYLGIYNIYNCLAAITFCLAENFDISFVKSQIENFDYKLGRMETINFPNKDVVLVLSKNPVGLSEVLNVVNYDEDPKSIMFCLNDAPSDGEDISWIWDADFKQINNIKFINHFYCSGTRANEILLRLKYEDFDIGKVTTYVSNDITDINEPIMKILSENEKSYIIGTFTAIPLLRKVLIREKEKAENQIPNLIQEEREDLHGT
jgi:lipid II isoglutaminyl synthase (glutamine-hydrolysing)